MNGFHRVLKFHIWGTYSNARKIADEIIISLVKNSGLKEEERDWLPTYTSTVREDFLSFLFSNDDDKDKLEETNREDRVSDWVIKIYEVRGNRQSRLSVTQNEELYNMVFK